MKQKNTKYTQINTNRSMHSKWAQYDKKTIKRIVRTAHLSVLMTVHSFYQILQIRDGPNVRLWHSAEAERVSDVRPNFGQMLCARMKRLLLVSALSG